MSTEHASADPGKPWFLSKTLWVNFLTGILPIAVWAFGLVDIDISDLTAEDLQAYAASWVGILAAVNMALRAVTGAPIQRASNSQATLSAGAVPSIGAILLSALVLSGCAGLNAAADIAAASSGSERVQSWIHSAAEWGNAAADRVDDQTLGRFAHAVEEYCERVPPAIQAELNLRLNAQFEAEATRRGRPPLSLERLCDRPPNTDPDG